MKEGTVTGRFQISLAALAAAAALGSQAVSAQAADATRAVALARRASAGPDSVATRSRAADSAAVRVVPVRFRSPGGVRIRSVRDNRRVVILAPPTRVVSAAAPADTAVRAGGATREDLERLEARLQAYFDARFRDLEIAEREAILSLSPRAAGAAGPAGLHGYPGATQVVVIPFAAPVSSSADSAAAGTASDTTAPDTSAAPFLGFRPPPAVTLLGPGASVAEIERAVLEGELLRAVNVIFEFNRAELLPVSLSILNSLGWVLAKHPDLRLEIGGHTDSSGPSEYNLRLSQARAEAVRDYLATAFSIDRERLTARGYGESMPVADESTPTGRALNRRVEFFVLRPGERREAPSPPAEEKRP